MEQLVNKKDFKIARARFEVTVSEVAEELGFTPQYIYEVIKYPNKNPELHRQIAEYCNNNLTE